MPINPPIFSEPSAIFPATPTTTSQPIANARKRFVASQLSQNIELHFTLVCDQSESGEVTALFKGTEETPFFTYGWRDHQMLPGGAMLLTEAERGQVIEIGADGGLVRDREIVWDISRTPIVPKLGTFPKMSLATVPPPARKGRPPP